MCPDLYNFPFVQNNYLVCITDSGKAVCYHNHRFTFIEIRQTFSNDSFVVCIEGIGSFVQKYEHRILIDYPRNQNALSLPLTDALSVLSYHRVIG